MNNTTTTDSLPTQNRATGKVTRIAKLIARHRRELERGKAAFDKASHLLDRAIGLGAAPGEPITLAPHDDLSQNERVVIIDNLSVLAEKGAIYRPARLPRFAVEDYREPREPREKKASTKPTEAAA